jgi:hypothetical protein
MPKRVQFASAFPLTGGPVSPEQILAFHRARFGDTRMEDKPADDAAAKAAADAQAAADKAASDKAAADKAAADAAAASADKGFPEGTPIAEMTAPQQAAYWKYQARKHEDTSKARADYDAVVAERDALKKATQTDAEKAVDEAKVAARKEALLEAAPKLVAAEFKAELKGTRSPEQIAALLAPLDLTKFLTADGEVDTDKVSTYAAGLGSAGKEWPDTGQGNRRTTAAKGVSAGADLFEQSRSKKTKTT